MMVLEAIYIVSAFYVFCKYGRKSVISKFRKAGNKLAFFFSIQVRTAINNKLITIYRNGT